MDVLVVILLIIGFVFFVGGTLGILRFPDFYSRLHPAGKLDTMGSLIVLLALAIFNLKTFDTAHLLVSLKMLLILVFIFLSSPTATHAIVDAGMRAGLTPWVRGEKRR
jgi:multicomponent Na+:H+ antiporter subunit G